MKVSVVNLGCKVNRVESDTIAAALKNVYERRESITHGVRIAWEAPLMRHFTVQLERL